MIPSTNHTAQKLAVTIGAAVLVASSIVVILWFSYVCGDGDGGVPFVARDSPRGHLCDGPLILPWGIALLLVPAAALLTVGLRGAARERWPVVGLAALLAVGALIGLAAPVLALPTSCSDADERAWVRNGLKPPPDCAKY